MADYQYKKAFGQHFLHDENMCRRIVQALDGLPIQRLLEVGPGAGAISKYLLQQPQWEYRMVEIDDEKVGWLRANLPGAAERILHADFLEIDPPFSEPFYLVGNFPYNISTQILFKVLEWGPLVQGITGMFQKEVAQRVAAGPGSKTYGITSVLVQAWYRVRYLFDVPPGCFTPPPKVMSGVISLEPLNTVVDMRSREDFFRLVKAAFGQRRKTLRNATRHLFPEKTLVLPIFQQRAEQLTVADFAALTFQMHPLPAG